MVFEDVFAVGKLFQDGPRFTVGHPSTVLILVPMAEKFKNHIDDASAS